METAKVSKIFVKSTEAMRTIGEVALMIEVPQYVLRFWESKFKQIQPYKSKGRRYFRHNDIELIKQIKHLLYTEGYTIKGVQNFFDNLTNIKSPKSQQIIQESIISVTNPISHDLVDDPDSKSYYDCLTEILDNLYKLHNIIGD